MCKSGLHTYFYSPTNENSLQIRKKIQLLQTINEFEMVVAMQASFWKPLWFYCSIFCILWWLQLWHHTYIILVQTVAQPSESCLPVLSPNHQLCNHGVIVHRNLITYSVATKTNALTYNPVFMKVANAKYWTPRGTHSWSHFSQD